MPQQLRVARGGMFAQAILALLGTLGVGLWAGSAISARLAGELAFTALPAALGLVLCRLMWRQGVWIPRLVLALQVLWAWGALVWLADGSWRGLTQLVLPVLIGVYITRPAAREWFTLPAWERAERPQRRPLLPFSFPHFIGWRRDRGQTATEYIGLLTVVVAIIGALVASGVTTEIGQSVAAKICRAVGTTCGSDGGGAPQAGDGADQGGDSDGDQKAGGNEGTPQGEPGRERNEDGEDPQRQPESKQEPTPKKEQEEKDEGCFSGFSALVSCGGDRVKDVGDGIKEAGGGIKDKFTGDYIDGPKELAKGLWNDPAGTAKSAATGVIDQATKPFQDAKETCDMAGGGAMGTTTCVLGWGNAVINYPNNLIASQVVDDDVKESIQNGELPRAGGQLLYNGATVALPFLKGGKILKTVGKAGKKAKLGGSADSAAKAADKAREAAKSGDAEGARRAAEEAQKHADEAAKNVKGCSLASGQPHRPTAEDMPTYGSGGASGSGTVVLAASPASVPGGLIAERGCTASPQEIEAAKKAQKEADAAKAAKKEASRKSVAKWKKPSWHGDLKNPRAGTKDSGGGKWKSKKAVAYWPKTERWMRYQEQVSGVKRGKEYSVQDPKTGRAVDFDGWDSQRQTYKEAKLGYGKKVRADGTLDPAQARKFVEQAQRQERAAGGKPIEWNFSNGRVAEAAQEAFDEAGVDVVVKHTPVKK